MPDNAVENAELGEGGAGDRAAEIAVRGRFEFKEDIERKPNNLEPQGVVPQDQEQISLGYYAIWNTLKLLKENDAFPKGANDPEYLEFLERNHQAATVG